MYARAHAATSGLGVASSMQDRASAAVSYVCNVVIKVGQIHRPTHLVSRHVLLRLEILEGAVVCKDLEMGAQEACTPLFESLDDG